MREGATGSWQARRDILNSEFGPLHDRLADVETQAMASSLADAVSPHGRAGWARVDEEVNELRRHFLAAGSPQDYRNVGNDCVIVLEALSRHAYSATRHLRPGKSEPPVSSTKQRLERVVDDGETCPENAALRKLTKAAIETAQLVKHRTATGRREAGIAADTVILPANIIRRLEETD